MIHAATRVSIEANPSLFEGALQEQLVKRKPLFVLVMGARVADTGKSWCPDCVEAEPLIHEALSKVPDHILLECPVLREEYKGNPDYPYRTHPQLKIKSVPTFIHWTQNGPRERLDTEFNKETLEGIIRSALDNK